MLHSERLTSLRKSKKLIQQDMADYLNITRTAYNRYETGKGQPPVDALSKLADFFGVTTDYLLGKTDDPTPPFKAPETFHTIPMAPPPEKEPKREAPAINEAEALRIYAEGKKGGALTQEELNRLDEFADIFIKGLNK